MVLPQLSNFEWVGGDAGAWPETWPHTWDSDDRTPLFTFVVDQQTTYAFYLLSLPFWVHMLSAVLLECAAAVPTALAIYYFIVKPQTQQKRQRTGTTATGYLIGWGLLLPLWVFLPAAAVNALGVTNIILRFCLCVISPTISIFRITEAMYGFAPPYATETAVSYAFYFCSPMLLLRQREGDSGTVAVVVPAGTRRVLAHLFKFAGFLLLTGCYQSLMLVASDHFPAYAGGPASTPHGYYDWSSLVDRSIWKDSLQWAVLFQIYLSTFAEGLMFATTLLTGKETAKFADNALLTSTSPSDFWGRRWNLLVHECLKNGVFKPVLSLGGARWLAVAATFAASGLFHEWLLPSVFAAYPNTHGITMAFFLWQGVLVAAEATVGHWFSGIAKMLPRPLRTALVIFMGLPVAHWFMDSYIRSNFFVHGQIALPMILAVPASAN